MDKILIIEDDENMAELMRRMCLDAGIKPREFRVVNTLEAGLSAMNDGPPDLAIADLSVPPLSEEDFIALGIPQISRRVPLVVVTGSANPDVVFQCHAAGAQACLLKQGIIATKCGVFIFAQTIIQATLNWKREHAPTP